MIVVRIPHVTRYEDRLKYRRVVPPDCREAIGRTNWTRTWKPETPIAEIEQEAKQLAAQHDALIARARGETEAAAAAQAESDYKRLFGDASPEEVSAFLYLAADGEKNSPEIDRLVKAILGGGKIKRKAMTVSQAFKHDRKTHSADIDPRPIHYAVKGFIEVVGDIDVLAITRADVSNWLAQHREQGYSPATIRRRYGALKALVDRTVRDLGSEKRSPFEHRVGGKSSPTDRLPLNRVMLDKLNTYLDSGRAGHETVNVLRLMMFTGAGPAEIGGLEVSDVSLDSAIPYISIRQNGIRPLKTGTRARVIPLVGPALAAAKDALERADDRERLFTSYSSARGADSLSAKLNKALRTAGIPQSPRLTSYSLRHSMSEALRLSKASYSIQRRLLGHSARDISDQYGSPAAMIRESREALEAAVPLLGQVDDTIYSPAEQL